MSAASQISFSGPLTLSDREHAWRDEDGAVHAIVDLGACVITFGSADEARAVAGKILRAADAMDALPPGGTS